MSVVIGYAAGDVDIALAVRNILTSRGIDVRLAPRTDRPSEHQEAGGVATMADCSHVVLLLSEYSIGGEEVQNHWQRAQNLGLVIVPVRIGTVPLPPGMPADHAIPYSQLGLEGTVQVLLRLLPHRSRRQPDRGQRRAEWCPVACPSRQPGLILRTVSRRGLMYAVGFGLAGSLGGAVGTALARAMGVWPTSPVGLGMVVALGCAVVGGGSCALAGALGIVLAGEIVGEEREGKSPGGSAFGAGIEMLIEGLGGALWGAGWGLMVGVAAGVFAGSLGLAIGGIAGLMAAGAVGGTIVGAALGAMVGLVATNRRRFLTSAKDR
jgi:hypothetical protein